MTKMKRVRGPGFGHASLLEAQLPRIERRPADTRRPQAAFSSSLAWRRAARVVAVGAEHPHELADDVAAVELGDGRAARSRADVSLTIVKWRSASDAICGRWVMQSTWRPAAERAQLLADRARGLAADAGVDLVEHERRRRRPRAGDAHQREHHARELAARRDLAQRPGGHARVRRDQELDLVAAGRPVAVARRDSATSNVAPSIASSASRSRTAPASAAPRPSRAPRAAPAASSASSARAAPSSRLGRPRAPPRRPSSSSRRARQRLGVREHRRDRAAVLALEPVEQRRGAPRPRRAGPGGASTPSP